MSQKSQSEKVTAVAKHRSTNRKWYQRLSALRKQAKLEEAKKRYKDFTVAFKRQLNEKRKRERVLR